MLLRVIRKSYDITTISLVKVSPRFGILLASMILATVFTILDIMASVHPSWFGATDGYVHLDFLTAKLTTTLQNQSLVEAVSCIQMPYRCNHP